MGIGNKCTCKLQSIVHLIINYSKSHLKGAIILTIQGQITIELSISELWLFTKSYSIHPFHISVNGHEVIFKNTTDIAQKTYI